MAMNKLMHPRNPYKKPPDFKKLAIDYPEFRKHAIQDLSGHVNLNFKDEGAVWSLTKSLLHKDFGLDVETIPGRLVPTLTLRLNYLLWIEDLMNLIGKSKDVRGIDIGTGACCIYPLLAAKHFSWSMIGTEIETDSYECAKKNVEKNNLENTIKVKKVVKSTFLVNATEGELDFCMCNPPFFKDDEEKVKNEKRSEPRNAPTGVPNELKVTGGEVSFVKNIIDESLNLKNNITIYTVMVGQKSSLGPLKEYLNSNGIKNFSSTMFCQGRTTRWGLAWSFDTNINIESANIQKKTQDSLKSMSCYTHSINIAKGQSVDEIKSKIMNELQKLEIEVVKSQDLKTTDLFILTAKQNTWIHSRRKRRELRRKLQEESEARSSQSTTSDEQPSAKKLKIDTEEEPYLTAGLFLGDEEEDVIDIKLLYYSGTGGKDSAYQLLQYIKNRI